MWGCHPNTLQGSAAVPNQTTADAAGFMAQAVLVLASAAHPEAGPCSHWEHSRALLPPRGQGLNTAVLLGMGQRGLRAGFNSLCVIL